MSKARALAAPGQMALPLGVCEEDIRAILEAATGRSVALTVTANATSMLSVRERAGRVQVRLHRMFLGAGDEVLREVAAFVARRGGRTPLVSGFINENHRAHCAAPARAVRLDPRGRHHDLGAIFAEMNERHFGGRIQAAITWGARTCGRRAARHRTLGSYSFATGTIRVSPLLDRPGVPRYYVEFIVHHEMLHAELGMKRSGGGRRVLHSREFRERERAYPGYERATAWEKTNLG